MTIRELSNCGGVCIDNHGNGFHRSWELIIEGRSLVLERYGSVCCWKSLQLKTSRGSVYKLSRVDNERTESFFGIIRRTYRGDQFSFVEFCCLAAEGRSPRKETGFYPADEKMYQDYLTRILAAA